MSRKLESGEMVALGLVWGFCELFGGFILATGEISLSTKRSGIVWSTGEEAAVMALVFIGIGAQVTPLLASRWLRSRGAFIGGMVISPGAHLAAACAYLALR